MPAARAAVALAAGLALADVSVVVLALPPILSELDASVDGVAAVIGVYTLTLALTLPVAARWGRDDVPRLGSAGMLVFAAACAGCGLAPSLGLLIVLRGAQGIAAAAIEPQPASGGGTLNGSALLCLGLLSAALTGVLFLLVLLLVSGWALSPLAAAAVVSVLPVAAFLGTRVPGDDSQRAIAGCALVGVGVLSLAPLTVESVAMTIAPQISAGVGMGMALPALAGGLLPERGAVDAARLLAVRHLGISLALLILAPIAAAQLDGAAERVREAGTALILDAELPPDEKLGLAEVATGDLDAIAPRDGLGDSLAEARREVDGGDLEKYDALATRADETLVTAVSEAFRPAFLVCGALALLAACGLLASSRVRLGGTALACCAVAGVLSAAQVGIAAAVKPDPVVIANPCEDRDLPGTGGLGGLLQDASLVLLDSAACRLPSCARPSS